MYWLRAFTTWVRMAAVKLPDPEELLVDYAQRLERHREGRLSVHIALSRIALDRKRTADVNLAANKGRDLAKFYRGEVFHLRNHDLVLMLKDVEMEHVKGALRQIQMLFQDDLNLQEDNSAFITVYRIDRQYQEFLNFAKEQRAQAQRRSTGRPPEPRQPSSVPRPSGSPSTSPRSRNNTSFTKFERTDA